MSFLISVATCVSTFVSTDVHRYVCICTYLPAWIRPPLPEISTANPPVGAAVGSPRPTRDEISDTGYHGDAINKPGPGVSFSSFPRERRLFTAGLGWTYFRIYVFGSCCRRRRHGENMHEIAGGGLLSSSASDLASSSLVCPTI